MPSGDTTVVTIAKYRSTAGDTTVLSRAKYRSTAGDTALVSCRRYRPVADDTLVSVRESAKQACPWASNKGGLVEVFMSIA